MLSLAAGTVLDARPEQVITAAAAAGFDACGLRLEPAELTSSAARELRTRAEDCGVALLDLEVVRLAPGRPVQEHTPLLDLAAALGASWVLTVVQTDEPTEQVDRLGELAALAEERGVRISLEFMAFTAVRTLPDALALVAAVPRCRVLVDALHLARTAGTTVEVAAAAAQLSYVQLCDAPAAAPGTATPAELADEARHRRLLPGAGELDLGGLVRAVPDQLPVSVEVQSDAMAAALSVDERARRAHDTAAAVLASA